MAHFRLDISRRTKTIKVALNRSFLVGDVGANYMLLGHRVPDLRREIADWLKRRDLRGVYTFTRKPTSPTTWAVYYYFSNADTAFHFKIRWG